MDIGARWFRKLMPMFPRNQPSPTYAFDSMDPGIILIQCSGVIILELLNVDLEQYEHFI
jgi:hypothetical protein